MDDGHLSGLWAVVLGVLFVLAGCDGTRKQAGSADGGRNYDTDVIDRFSDGVLERMRPRASASVGQAPSRMAALSVA